jgi:Domain of unknown function (DUF1905)
VDERAFEFEAELWEWEGKAAWYFVSLPDDVADDIDERFGHRAGGFGSVRVEVTVGRTVWRTSLFPDSKRRTYVLPVKRPVRTAEGLSVGDVLAVALVVLV